MCAVRAVGIDVGTTAHHAVLLRGADTTVSGRHCLPTVTAVHMAVLDRPGSLDALVELCARADAVGIDAPDRQTGGCSLHAGARGRCAEVALAARAHGRSTRLVGGPVSMLTPAWDAPFPERLGWMRTGFALWRELAAACPDTLAVETYPSGSFRRLAAGASPPVRLAPRRRRAAALQRLELLTGLAEIPATAAMWSLDGVDALAAALAVYGLVVGRGAVVAHHEHAGEDGSRIVLVA